MYPIINEAIRIVAEFYLRKIKQTKVPNKIKKNTAAEDIKKCVKIIR